MGSREIDFARACVFVLASLGSVFSYGHQLDAEAAPEERRLLGIPYSRGAWLERQIFQWGAPLLFSDPIHEELTTRIFGCDGDAVLCGGPSSITVDSGIMVGVRWNDDPPFRLAASELKGTRCKPETIRFQTQPSCWLQLSLSAEKKAAQGKVYGPGDGLLYRTHFGDLQFLHAMGYGDGADPLITQQKILDWAQFTWRVAIKEWPRSLKMRDVPIPGFSEHFGYTEWDVRDLFIQGTPCWSDASTKSHWAAYYTCSKTASLKGTSIAFSLCWAIDARSAQSPRVHLGEFASSMPTASKTTTHMPSLIVGKRRTGIFRSNPMWSMSADLWLRPMTHG